MNALFRRITAIFALLTLFAGWPLVFVNAQGAPATNEPVPIAIIGDSQNEGFSGYNTLSPLLSGYQVVGALCNRSWSVDQLRSGGGPSGSNASCFRNQSAISYLNSLSTRPRAIIVFAGGNGTDTAAGLQSFVTDLKAVAPVVIWIGPFHSKTADVQARHIANSQTQKNTLPSAGVQWIEAIAINPAFTYSDGTHFTRSEYAQISQQLAPQILQYLSAIDSPAGAATSTVTIPPAPVTDALGRTQEEVNQSVAARCSPANPIFPVRLGVAIGGTNEVNGLTEYINLVYRYMTSIVLVVAIVMVTYGGFRYLVSATPLGVSDGKDIIKNGIVGMVLVLGAYVILNSLNPATTVLQFTRPPADIACRDYEASLGLIQPGISETQRRELINTPVGSTISYWDPLLLRARPMVSCNALGTPTDASDLSTARRIFNDVVSGSCPANQLCVEADEYAQSVANQSLSFATQGQMNFCSDGGLYSVCSDVGQCNEAQGLICLGSADALLVDEWQVCVKEEGNEEGSPCGRGFASSEGPSDRHVEAGCAPGLACVLRQKNYPDDDQPVVNDDLKVCARIVPTATLEDIRAVNAAAPGSERFICKYHRDCQEEGARCVSDDVTDNKRVCAPAAPRDGVACGLVREGNPSDSPSYFPCSGTDGFSCVFCPDESNAIRNWTTLNGTTQLFSIGQCKPTAQVGQNCTGR